MWSGKTKFLLHYIAEQAISDKTLPHLPFLLTWLLFMLPLHPNNDSSKAALVLVQFGRCGLVIGDFVGCGWRRD